MKTAFKLIIINLLISSSCKHEELAEVKKQLVNVKLHKTPEVVILGSSTAEGVGANPIDSSWVNRFKTACIKRGDSLHIINLAKGGYTTYQIMPATFIPPANKPKPDNDRNLSKALKLNPDLIIINLPTNDIASGYTDEEILRNYSVLTDSMKKYQVPYLITSTQPRNLSTEGRLCLKEFNNKMRAVYFEKYINYYFELSAPDYSLNLTYNAGDGIHVNNAGHAIISKAILDSEYLKSLLLMYEIP